MHPFCQMHWPCANGTGWRLAMQSMVRSYLFVKLFLSLQRRALTHDMLCQLSAFLVLLAEPRSPSLPALAALLAVPWLRHIPWRNTSQRFIIMLFHMTGGILCVPEGPTLPYRFFFPGRPVSKEDGTVYYVWKDYIWMPSLS